MACDPQRAGEAPTTGGLRIGTWNMSHWTVDKVQTIVRDVPVDILALQETHLAPLPLEWARTTAASSGLHLHHGRPSVPLGNSPHGKSCGVGFVGPSGTPLSPVLPNSAPWRALHAMRRLSAVQLPPRPDLPRGLLLVSLYAPLQSQPVERSRFVLAMLELTHTLDMQLPTLLLGDFNGYLLPSRDTASGTRNSLPACPLLAALLGPGGAWTDVHASLLPPPLPWTFQHPTSAGPLASSRIDLILANRAAMALVVSAEVLPAVRSGGHCPVLVTLSLSGPITIRWQRPRPKLPHLLQLPSAALSSSEDWAALVQQWSASPEGHAAMSPLASHTLESLSQALLAALHHLVQLAGGWRVRPLARRRAYDSDSSRHLRHQLTSLRWRQALMQRPCLSPGGWPRPWMLLLDELQSVGVQLPRTTIPALLTAVSVEIQQRQRQLSDQLRAMRQERHRRWKATLPLLWQERPRVIFHWLHATGPPWGSTPILDATGQQCLTVEAVDAAVRSYWVDTVLRHHAPVDEDSCWAAFSSSRFGPHIPSATWPSSLWNSERVRDVLRHMREGASPGSLGIPIAVWRALPEAWMSSVARLFVLVEEAGQWPSQWLEAYVTMIPKAAGGSRPRDQRPITVLDVLYRIWAKGTVLTWGPTLQNNYLGAAAMGFRAQTGAVPLVQLLSDIIALQRRRQAPLWLASFDIEKCYDMLPWWALFRTLLRAGVAPQLVAVFQSFYKGLRRRFRYGQVDGGEWQAANGLAQGCPASPDLLNILFEAFHRWAQAAGCGVEVAGYRVPSVSFADDLALVASSKQEMVTLVTAYLEWCSLLDVKVVKVQLWSSLPGSHTLQVADRTLETSPTFRIVGVVLASCEATATRQHFAPRLEKALATAQRLRCLPLPASVTALLWRSTVLPQALYGSEVRDIRRTTLAPLSAAGRALFVQRQPLYLNLWRSPLVLFSPSLGDSTLRDPMLEMRERQLRWLHLLANSPGVVGAAHRVAAFVDGQWTEPTPALGGALAELGWSVRRNLGCLRGADWPQLAPERSYPGPVLLEPVDQFPSPGAAFTDGSVSSAGGAAVVLEYMEHFSLATVPVPRSSTHCELVALCLALTLAPAPPQVITDSLTALRLARGWGGWPVARTLRCADRVEVRQLLHLAQQLPQPPVLEKVKAHDAVALATGHPKAVGNDLADQLARRAAEELGHPVWQPDASLFGDPVELVDASGAVIFDVLATVRRDHWALCRHQLVHGRPWFANFYPADTLLDWRYSSVVFRRPAVSAGSFVYPVSLVTIKWIGRLRAGCLATGLRRHQQFGPPRVPTPACLCCGAAEEDDLHAVGGCPATGSADWEANLTETWRAAAVGCHLTVPMPPLDWLQSLRFPLLAALIPASLAYSLPLPTSDVARFLTRLHQSLAQMTAEVLRRRQELMSTLAASAVPSVLAPSASRPCPLPPERQLSVSALRRLEVQRRAAQEAPADASPPPVAPVAPPAGDARRVWLQSRLATLINEDTVVCDVADGVVTPCLLELFERVTGEVFTMLPGARLTARIQALSRMLVTLLARGELLEAPLLQGQRVLRAGSYSCWNRRPRVWADWEAWQRQVRLAETFQAGTPALRTVMGQVDGGLAGWLKQHRYLQPVELVRGECSMALLLLWEVEHGRSFPSAGAAGGPALAGFTRRLMQRVAADADLKLWLVTKEVQQPLAPGLPDSHHTRWSVRICPPPPSDPQGWYAEFTSRWLAYLGSLAQPLGRSTASAVPSVVASSSTSASVSAPALPSEGGRRRPRSATADDERPRRRRVPVPPRPPPVDHDLLPLAAPVAPPPPAVAAQAPPATPPAKPRPQPRGRLRQRSPSPVPTQQTAKRQRDVRSWLRPKARPAPTPAEPPPQDIPPSRSPEHGRATLGPPT